MERTFTFTVDEIVALRRALRLQVATERSLLSDLERCKDPSEYGQQLCAEGISLYKDSISLLTGLLDRIIV